MIHDSDGGKWELYKLYIFPENIEHHNLYYTTVCGRGHF